MSHSIDVPDDWHARFFTPPVNRFWETMVPAAATAADVAFVQRHSCLRPPAHILDVPCGAGRHALALAERGYHVTGIDISSDAIGRAATYAAERGVPATFHLGDMRDIRDRDRYDAAICLGNSFGYFDDAATQGFLGALALAVKKGGHLILDTHCCAESIFPLGNGHEIALPNGSYSSRHEYDARRSLLRTEALLALDGERHVLRYQHSIITSGALVESLARAGFGTLGLHADTDGKPFEPGDRRLLLVARRE